MYIVSVVFLAGCGCASLAWLASGCSSSRAGQSDAHTFHDLGIVTEADDGIQAQDGRGPLTDFMERHSQKLAGPRGINCGRVGISENPAAATKCALRSQASKRPFRVRYDIQGIDSSVAVAMVRTPSGIVSTLMYDSDPAGAGGQLHGVIHARPCPNPLHLRVNSKGRIDCFPKETSRLGDELGDVMSP